MTRDARRPGTRGRATTQLLKGTAGTRQEPDARTDGIAIARGETLERVLFRGSRKPMDRRELHVALEPIVRAWLDAACTWDDPAIGDYRFVIFSLEVAPDVVVYVQFWSEPFEPVLAARARDGALSARSFRLKADATSSGELRVRRPATAGSS